MYSSKDTNPFYENGEESDEESSYKPPSFSNNGYDRRQHTLQQIDVSEDRQLASTQRALASIYDSERMGITTAEELVRQGEQLDNIELKTEEINKNLTISQKHLNSIKSVFGGMKTWWSGGNTKPTTSTPPERSSALKETVSNRKESDTHSGMHPALRLKSEDGRGFYEDNYDLDSKFMAGARSERGDSGPMFKSITKSEKERDMERNLSMMSDGMAQLKSLAQNMGNEIGQQNDQLDRINTKVVRTDDILSDKTSQMRKILHK